MLRTMKLFKIFFYTVCSLLYAAFLAVPQLFAIDNTMTNVLKGDKTYPGREMTYLQWKNMGEGVTYRCQISKDKGFQHIILDRKCEKPEITFPRPDDSGTY